MADTHGPGVHYRPPPRSTSRAWGDFRRVHRAGHGVAVGLPRWAVDHLGIVAGQHVHISLGADGSVVLDNPRVISVDGAGRLAAAERIAGLGALVLKLRRRLRASWLAGYGAGVCYGWHRAFGESFDVQHPSLPPSPSSGRGSIEGGAGSGHRRAAP